MHILCNKVSPLHAAIKLLSQNTKLYTVVMTVAVYTICHLLIGLFTLTVFSSKLDCKKNILFSVNIHFVHVLVLLEHFF